MKPRRNILLLLQFALISIIALALAAFPARAATPHEPPESAATVFSGISLFRYYTEALDFTLNKDPETVETRLGKMPFANVPPELEEDTGVFATSGVNLAYLVKEADANMSLLDTLVAQYRFGEARSLISNTQNITAQAGRELGLLRGSVGASGDALDVLVAPVDSDLRGAYEAVLERLQRLEEMLARYDSTLAEMVLRIETPGKLLRPSLTLEIAESSAFVGEDVHFSGRLTSAGAGLPGRNITLMANGQVYLTAAAGAAGYYQGVFTVPSWYVPNIDLQTLYYPADDDIGKYLSAVSPLVGLNVSFYESRLEIEVAERAYPGLETAIDGKFDYSPNAVPEDREIEIYLDDILLATVMAGAEFSRTIALSADLPEGDHIVTVSAAASGRYTAALDSAVLRVTRAVPVLEMELPTLALIPGSISLSGRLDSTLGPPAGAMVKIDSNGAGIEAVTAADGSFDTVMRMGMAFTLFGSQEMGITVTPVEPWQAPLVAQRKLLVLNVINCGVTLLLLAAAALLLRARTSRMKIYRRPQPIAVGASPAAAPVYQDVSVMRGPSSRQGGTLRQHILQRYRQILLLLQKLTGAFISPQKTLREFARESSQKLGPLAGYLLEFTALVERLLYSSYQPEPSDEIRSQELGRNIEKGIENETG